VLSDAALSSVLISSYRAKLLLPQLKPPVNTTSQVNRDAAARAEDQQNADKQQSAVNNAKRIDAQNLTAAALDRAANLQRQIDSSPPPSPLPKRQPPADRVTISRVSEIAPSTLANVSEPLEKAVPAEVVRAAISEAPKVYTPRAVTKPAVVDESSVSLPPSSATIVSSNRVAVQQYQRNAFSSSSGGEASQQGSASSGVNVRA